ncbi:hypothetical protein [Sedimentibacter saalensis]|uniref:hypothetical protein n=1 Tax=Sedimentibacter saalensis TaxID=130788 RepID=UPI0028A265E6|nr:hypothetical protein [Sedimentibacter saalensis]
MTDIREVQKALLLLSHNIDCLAWEDYKDSGSPCIDWFNLSSTEQRDYLTTKINVEMLMHKKSALFRSMERSLAQVTGSTWVTYDWTIKSISRAIAFCNFKEFYEMITLSRVVRMGMAKRGLSQINSFSEAFE